MHYKSLCKKIILLGLTVASLILAGCQSDKVYNQTEGNVADVVQRTADARHKSDTSGKP